MMTLFVTVIFKNHYGLPPSNGLIKRPLLLWLNSNGRCGGVVGLGSARIIGNARCFAPVTDVLLCNGLLAPVTNVVLPIWGFHVVQITWCMIHWCLSSVPSYIVKPAQPYTWQITLSLKQIAQWNNFWYIFRGTKSSRGTHSRQLTTIFFL